MYCPECGAAHTATNKFCTKCGAALASPPAPSSALPPHPSPSTPKRVARPSLATGRPGWLLPTAGVVGLIILLLVGFNWFQGWQAAQRQEHYRLGVQAFERRIWDTAVDELGRVGDYLDAPSKLATAREQLVKLTPAYEKGIAAFNQGNMWDAAALLSQVAALHPNYRDTNDKLKAARLKNGKIVYATIDNSNIAWFFADPDGKNAEKLAGSYDNIFPRAFRSPDGKRIIIISSRDSSRPSSAASSGLFFIDLETGQRRDLPSSEELGRATFSPDSRKVLVAFQTEQGGGTVATYDADGRNQRDLPNVVEAYFSPDSRRLLLQTTERGRRTLYLADPDGSNRKPVETSADFAEGRFSADGKLLLITTTTGAGAKVFVADSEGGARRELASGEPGTTAQWAPDGKRLLLTEIKTGAASLSLVGADGGGRQPLATDAVEADAVYSRSGQHIVAWSRSGSQQGNWTVYLFDGAGSNKRTLTENVIAVEPAPWDNRDALGARRQIYGFEDEDLPLLYIQSQAGSSGLHRIDPETGQLHAVGEMDNIIRSSDGKLVAHLQSATSMGGRPVTLTVSDATGVNPKTLVTDAEFASAHFSPDGHKLLFTQYKGNSAALYAADANGDNVVRLLDKVVIVMWPHPQQ